MPTSRAAGAETRTHSQYPTLLIVDDQEINREILQGILAPEYRVVQASSGEAALRLVAAMPPDLVLLDVQMPDMSGFEVCRSLKALTEGRHLPVIFVTSLDEEMNEAAGFEAGGVDYITKPVSPMIVLARVRAQLALAAQNRELERRVLERTSELAKVQDVAIYGLSVLAEYRDDETGAHILRTKEYVRLLAESLALLPEFGESLDPRTRALLTTSAPLHDIGKVGIPDSILLKPEKLSQSEFEVMKSHASIGHEVIVEAERALEVDENLSFFRIARELTISHHERWDGSGYPAGLAGRAIPLPGRIMAVADVYDALSSKRVYKPAYPHDRVMALMYEGAGSQFDPAIFTAFTGIVGSFRRYAEEIGGQG